MAPYMLIGALCHIAIPNLVLTAEEPKFKDMERMYREDRGGGSPGVYEVRQKWGL